MHSRQGGFGLGLIDKSSENNNKKRKYNQKKSVVGQAPVHKQSGK